MSGCRGVLNTGWLGFVAGIAVPRDTDKLAFRTVARHPVSADGHATNKDTCSPPATAFRDAYRARHRLPVLPTGRVSGLSGRPVLSLIRPSEQRLDSPETLAHRALRETLIAFPARFPTPSSSVSNQAGGWPESQSIDSAVTPTAGQ